MNYYAIQKKVSTEQHTKLYLKRKKERGKKKKEEMETLKIIIPYCVTYNVMYHEGSN